MGYIIVIYGASGSGKTSLVSELAAHNPDIISVHLKATTRNIRTPSYPEDKSASDKFPVIDDVVHVGDEIQDYDYVYNSYGYTYGIQKSQIISAINSGKLHFLICNNKEVIMKIKKDFPGMVIVLFLDFDFPEEVQITSQNRKRISENEINLRLAAKRNTYNEYLSDPNFFDIYLMNRYNVPISNLVDKIENYFSICKNNEES